MKSKKILITLIVLVLALIILIGSMVFVYAKTDFLKTDEQLFYKYIGQIGERLEEFDSKELDTYFQKADETPYESEGKLDVDVNMKSLLSDNHSKLVNDLNITFSGKTNKKENKSEQKININYSDNVSFPIEYRQTGNLYGITSNLLLTKYLAIKNENIEELIEKFEDDNTITSTPRQIEALISNINRYNIDIETFMQILKTSLNENITNANFSKANDNNFVLTLNEKEIKTIGLKIIEELKNNKILTEEEASQMIEELQDILETDKEALKINVDKNGLINIEVVDFGMAKIQVDDNNEITISIISEDEEDISVKIKKNTSGNELSYRVEYVVSMEEQKSVVYFEAKYQDLTSQIAKEKYLFGFGVKIYDESISYDYNLDIAKKFNSDIDIEVIGEENSVILNDVSKEYLDNITNMLELKISEVNRLQMEQLGITENENPLIFATPIGYVVYEFMNNAMSSIVESEESWNKMTDRNNQEGNSMGDVIDRANEFISSNS